MIGQLFARTTVWIAVTSLGGGRWLRMVLAPVAHIADGRVLHKRGEHHKEAYDEIDVDGFEIRDLRQRGVSARDECGHGEYGGDAEGDTSGYGVPV